MAKLENNYFNIDSLAPEIQEAAVSGAAIVRDFLTKDTLAGLQQTCSSLEYYLLEEQHTSSVSERYFKPQKISEAAKEQVGMLQNQLETLIQQEGKTFPVLSKWQATGSSIQLYDKDSYITPHRDGTSYKGVVVVASIQGEAIFETSQEREGPVQDSWTVNEGDVVILGATGLYQQKGIFHAVSGATSETPRISIGFRNKQ